MKGLKIFSGLFLAGAVASVRLGLFGTTDIHAPVEYDGSSNFWTVVGERLKIHDKDGNVLETHYSVFPIQLLPPDGYEFDTTRPVFTKKRD